MKKSRKEKPQRFDISLKVFVTNLPLDDELTWKSLVELCASCGKIQDENFFAKNIAGQRIQQGLLVFSSPLEAEKAAKLTGHVLGDRHIILRRHNQCIQTSDANDRTVHISNLSKETDEEDVWKFFEKCGSIEYIHIHRLLGVTSHVGEVLFEDAKSVRKALKLHEKVLKENEISVTTSALEENSDQFVAVFVTGLPQDVSQENICDFFDGCGPIKRIKVGKQGAEEAKATVFFVDSESAENALACDGNELDGYTIYVSQRESYHNEHYQNAVYVAGLSGDCKDVDLFLKFQDCGLIHNIWVTNCQGTYGQQRKGVVEFQDPEAIERALAMENLELKGLNLLVSSSKDVWTQPLPDKTSLNAFSKRKSTSFESGNKKSKSKKSKINPWIQE